MFSLKVAIYTLGCKVNQYESDSMADSLKKAGYQVVPFEEHADIYIINTCSVTNMAERKSRQIIHRARKNNPDASIVAVGCYVQAAKEELEKDLAVDYIVGNNRKKDIVRIVSEIFGSHEISDNYIDINHTAEYESMKLDMPTEHTRAYVKVQDGCNNFCTYCIIPYARGRIRSRDRDEVRTEIEGLAERGIKEIVLTGINLSSYGQDRPDENFGLLELLVMVSGIEGIRRIRMGSLEPRVITENFLETISGIDKICPHFHLSLQSACDDTLKRMNRHYTIAEYMEKCEMIRRYYDRPAITTDVIVGFPGETDEEFAVTEKNLEKLNLYEMHIFKYSKRTGTPAARMPDQVPEQIKDVRSAALLHMTAHHKKAYEESFAGEKLVMLAEEYDCVDAEKNIYELKGHTERYMLVKKQGSREYCMDNVNELVSVVL
jgi:threonylcarbamoyladenosine tRNA methylthiotransferase MtaB